MHGAVLIKSNRSDILWLDENLAMNYTVWNDIYGVWPSGPGSAGVFDNLGGTFTSPPAAVAVGENGLEVFGLGMDYALYHKSYDAQADANGQHWSPDWENLGGNLSCTPVVLAPASDRIDVFALGADQGMVHRTRTGTSWSAWQELGGCFTSEPVVLPLGTDAFDIFARGADFLIYQAKLTPAGMSDWEPLGGGLLREPTAASAPAAVRAGDDIYVFVVGIDQAIWFTRFDGTVWKPWSSLGGTFVSQPVATALVPASDVLAGAAARFRIDVFAVQAPDQSVWSNVLTAQGWRGWSPIDALGGQPGPGKLACAPSVITVDRAISVVAPPPAHFQVLEPDLDGTLHLRHFDGTLWTRWDVGPQYRLPSAYVFTIDSFGITDTMAAHNDTDTVTATLSVGAWPAPALSYQAGDVDNGEHQLFTNVQFPLTNVDLCEPALMSWSIVNADNSAVEKVAVTIMVKAAEDMINDGFKALLGPIGSLGGALASAVLDEGLAFAFGGCDGVVAVGSASFATGRLLQQAVILAPSGQLTGSVPYTGSNSNFGCGNSHYTVNWSIQRAG